MAGLTVRRKRNVKKGIQFCLMVCGASGTGRTTFVNTLCGQQVLRPKNTFDPANAHVEAEVQINPITVELELEGEGPRIALTIVDTPGFGDLINNEDSFAEISGYLERQYDDILAEESKVKRNPRFRDNRVHALLYFITPTGHGLRELDIQLMTRLSPRVNVIPVVGKADSLTPAELAESKRLIMEDIERYNIEIYNFPYDIEYDDEETVEENAELRALMPFAIVGSEEYKESRDGRKVRAREYPWGLVEVENPSHCDFVALRNALFYSHLSDLKEITHDILYERYRTEKLSSNLGVENVDVAYLNPEDLTSQPALLRSENQRQEQRRLQAVQEALKKEIAATEQQLLARKSQLDELGLNSSKPDTPSSGAAQVSHHS